MKSKGGCRRFPIVSPFHGFVEIIRTLFAILLIPISERTAETRILPRADRDQYCSLPTSTAIPATVLSIPLSAQKPHL
eukprot:1176218-Prorocentrum_minimum.AAC.1